MDQEVKERWVAALRSGKYEQGDGYLHRGDEFCCLGVLCDISEQGRWVRRGGVFAYVPAEPCLSARASLPESVRDWAGLPDVSGAIVTIDDTSALLDQHNDRGRTFSELADAIEAQL